MARFTRFRRSAGLLALAAGFWLGPSPANAADNPEFTGNSLRLVKASAVSCFEARVAYEHQRGNLEYRQKIIDFSLGMDASSALDYRPAIDCAEGFFFIGGTKSPSAWGELRSMISSFFPVGPQENSEDVFASAKHADIAARLAVEGAKKFTISSLCGVTQSAISFNNDKCFRSYVIRFAPTNELVAPHTLRHEDERESLLGAALNAEEHYAILAKSSCQSAADECLTASDKILSTTVSSEIVVQLPSFNFNTVTTSVSVPDGGTIQLSGIIRQKRGFDPETNVVARITIAAHAAVFVMQDVLNTECQSIEIEISPLVEPGLIAVHDAAPVENPMDESGIEPASTEFVQHLPPRGDAPFANPAELHPANRVSAPTVTDVAVYNPSRGIFQRVGTKLVTPGGELYLDNNVQQTAHDEPVAPNPFDTAPAAAFAFDGPAQITLQDGPGNTASGYAWPAQPAVTLTQPAGTLTLSATHEESLDDLTRRLEREFLHRAVNGLIDASEPCPGECAENMPTPTVCGNSGDCPSVSLARCSNTNAACQASTAAGCSCVGCPKACGAECCCAKKDHPVPVVTLNPYVAGPATLPTCGPETFAQQAPQMAPHPQWIVQQMAMATHYPHGDYTTVASAPMMAPCAAPVSMPGRAELNPAALETHRDISRTLEQMAERCEAQGLYQQADGLRSQAHEFRQSARAIQGHLTAMAYPLGPIPTTNPVAWFPTPPVYAAPPMYIPESAPALPPAPLPVPPATYSQPRPVIAQPATVPRY